MHWLEKFFVNGYWDKIFHRYFGLGRLLKKITDENFSSILEIGAGVGITTESIHKKFPRSLITATDYDIAQVDKAKSRLAGTNMVVQREDATQLTFTNNSFDACFAIMVFHHIQDFPKAIKEVYRVLKPSGKFYVIDIQSKLWTLFHLKSFKSLNAAPGLFTKEEFENIFKQSGFKILNHGGKWMFWLAAEK